MSAAPSKIALAAQRSLIAGLILSIVATTGIGAVLALGGASESMMEVMLGSAAIIALCFGLLVTFTVVLRRDDRLLICVPMAIGVVVTPLATTLIVTMLIAPRRMDLDEETLAKFGVLGFGLAIALAYTGALAQVRTPSWLIRAMAIGTGACAWAGGLMLAVIVIVLEEMSYRFDTFILCMIVLGVLFLLMVTGTIAVPIAVVSKASKARQSSESLDPGVRVHFGCPKCSERQTHRPGFIKCVKCGAGLFVEIEEPRCECGYLLYQLTGDTCPECGRAVAQSRGDNAR